MTSINRAPSGTETLPPQPFEAQRAHLAQEVENEYLADIQSFPDDPEERNRLYQEMNTGAVFHVADILEKHKDEITGLHSTLSVAAENHPHAQVLEEIFTGLTQAPLLDPTTGADHPFFRTEKIHKEGMDDWVWNELDLTKLSGYRDTIRELSVTSPEFINEWNRLDDMVEMTMETAGARYLSQQWLKRNSDDYTDKATGKILQMTGFILAAAAAAITGTIAFASKKSFTAPLLYAGIAGLIASPQLRRMLFGAPNAAAVETINAVLMNKPFLRQCKKYNVQGEGWANMANDCFGPEAEVRKFLHDVKDPELNHNDVIDTFVSGYPEIEESLRRMIADNGFEGFVDVLKGGKSEQESQVILDYIRLGSWTYAKDLEEVQIASENIEASGTV